MPWADVGKKRGGGDATFVRIPKDGKVTVRVLEEEPVTIRQHKISQVKNGQEAFMSLNCSGEDCFVCSRAKTRFPPIDQWAANVLVLSGMEDQKKPEVRVLVGGIQIWGAMKTLFESFGDIRSFDIQIAKEGENRDTKYTVSASPKSTKINVAAELKNRKDELFDMEEVFVVASSEDQERMIADNKIDIDYDPVFERMKTMTLDEAMKTKITFGKKKGSTVREVFISDPRYLAWMAVNVTSSVDVGAAARLVIEHGTKKDSPKTGRAETEADTGKVKPKSASRQVSAAPPATTLLDRVRSFLADNEPYASSIDKVADLLKKFGKGKKRLDAFAEADLNALAKHLKVK